MTAAAMKGAWEMKYLNTNGVFFKILEMALSNNSSVIRTFDIEQGLSRAGSSSAAAERCPRLWDQQTVAKPRVPCRLLITYFFIFNHKVHVFYCSWYNFAAHLSRPAMLPVRAAPSPTAISPPAQPLHSLKPGQGFHTQGLYCFVF